MVLRKFAFTIAPVNADVNADVSVDVNLAPETTGGWAGGAWEKGPGGSYSWPKVGAEALQTEIRFHRLVEV